MRKVKVIFFVLAAFLVGAGIIGVFSLVYPVTTVKYVQSPVPVGQFQKFMAPGNVSLCWLGVLDKGGQGFAIPVRDYVELAASGTPPQTLCQFVERECQQAGSNKTVLNWTCPDGGFSCNESQRIGQIVFNGTCYWDARGREAHWLI